MTVVISQPMYFPWVGLFEQIKLADVFVYYDDVQYSRGSFTNRVQLKCEHGRKWMTIPQRSKLGQKIDEVKLDGGKNWRAQHLEQFRTLYSHAPHYTSARDLMDAVFALDSKFVSDVAIASMNVVIDYFNLNQELKVVKSSDLGVKGGGWKRVLEIVKLFSGDSYITGHGAKNYLNHEEFELEGIDVKYLDYQMKPYPQSHGEFLPFVSILDLVANCGFGGNEFICSGTKGWREFNI